MQRLLEDCKRIIHYKAVSAFGLAHVSGTVLGTLNKTSTLIKVQTWDTCQSLVALDKCIWNISWDKLVELSTLREVYSSLQMLTLLKTCHK